MTLEDQIKSKLYEEFYEENQKLYEQDFGEYIRQQKVYVQERYYQEKTWEE